jgi:hypothetical protein
MQRKDSTDHNNCVTEHTQDGERQESRWSLTYSAELCRSTGPRRGSSVLLAPAVNARCTHDARSNSQLPVKFCPTVQNATRSTVVFDRILVSRRVKM